MNSSGWRLAYRTELVAGSAWLKALAGKFGTLGLTTAEQYDSGVKW